MGTPTTKTEVLRTLLKETVKEYDEFDVDNRVSKKYIAPSFAAANSPCFVIEYIYYPGTVIVKGRKEGYGVWLAGFEDPDLLVDDLSNQLTDDLGNRLLGVL